jgi:hypothetical protein
MKLSLEISVSYRSGPVRGTFMQASGMVQGRFVMASWVRRLFQISDRNNNGKKWVILQITQLEYLQTNDLMFRWRTFIFDVKFRLDCTTVGPIDSFQFKIVWL